MITAEQRVNLPEPQRALLCQPTGDALAMRSDVLPLAARIGYRTGLHALRNLVNFRFGGFVSQRQRQRCCRFKVALLRLMPVSRDTLRTLFPAARRRSISLTSIMISSLYDMGLLPTATRAVVRTKLSQVLIAASRTGP